MRKVYICSPYRAKDGAELDRNIDYAQQLTRQALEAGLAPITPHLYMTQCMDDKKPEERARGMAAGLALLKGCDFVIAGVKYGITEGMDREIHTANTLGIAVIDASQIKAYMRYEEKRQERAASDYAKLHECKHCYERRLCSLMGYENCCTAKPDAYYTFLRLLGTPAVNADDEEKERREMYRVTLFHKGDFEAQLDKTKEVLKAAGVYINSIDAESYETETGYWLVPITVEILKEE